MTQTILDDYVRNRQTAVHTDCVLCQSSAVMDHLPDNRIHLMVTSPLHNAQKEGGVLDPVHPTSTASDRRLMAFSI